MTRIHVLKGTGDNCTCGDCSVLYGGTCYTTPINNFLDRIEKTVKSVSKNEGKIVSKADMRRALEAMRPLFRKRYKITGAEYDKCYYGYLPLAIFCANGYAEGSKHNYDKSEARHFYRLARFWVLRDLEKNTGLDKKK